MSIENKRLKKSDIAIWMGLNDKPSKNENGYWRHDSSIMKNENTKNLAVIVAITPDSFGHQDEIFNDGKIGYVKRKSFYQWKREYNKIYLFARYKSQDYKYLGEYRVININHKLHTLLFEPKKLNHFNSSETFEYIAWEGGPKKEYTISKKYRDTSIIKKFKQIYSEKTNGDSPCEICNVSHKDFDLSTPIIEAAHKKALHKSNDELIATKIEDIAFLCPTCHKIIDREKYSVSDINNSIKHKSINKKKWQE